MIAELVEHLLTPWAMYVLWASVTLMGLVLAKRLHPTALHISAGALPWAVFYLWTALGLWASQAEAVAYSRIAGAMLALNLLVGMVQVCRLACGLAWKKH